MRAMQDNPGSTSDSDDDDYSADENEENSQHDIILQKTNEVFTILSVIRCSCHVLNLAVTSALKKLQAEKIINEIRSIVKQFKSLKYKRIIKELKIPRPKLDVETRWNSLYMMFASLISIKERLNEVYAAFPRNEASSIKITNEQWEFIQKFCDAFKPPYDATKRLQSVQLPMSKSRLTLFKGLIQFFFACR